MSNSNSFSLIYYGTKQPFDQNVREIEKKELSLKKEVKKASEISLTIKTEVIQKQEDIFARITDFYKNSNEIKFCSQADGIKLVYNSFF